MLFYNSIEKKEKTGGNDGMETLLESYSPTEILVGIVLLALAFKECVTFIDWLKGWFKRLFDKDYKAEEERKKVEGDIHDLQQFFDERQKVDGKFDEQDKRFDTLEKETDRKIQTISEKVDILLESDKDRILAYITEKHHYFVYVQKWIDYHSLECLEKQFAIYEKKEHGNSFGAHLMEDIRELPQEPQE